MSPASSLLNAMGQAEADDLGLEGGPLYDPLGNYRRVAGSWSDWAGEPRHPTVATSTVAPEEAAAGRDSADALGKRAVMQTSGREPSMEDILASIKKVIAEEKELRAAAPPAWPETEDETQEEDVLELEEVLEEPPPLAPPVDLGPPLIDDEAADASRQALDTLSTVAASVPPPRSSSIRWKRWFAKCSARSSSNGSTIICRASSTSMSSARSRGSRAGRSSVTGALSGAAATPSAP